MKYVAFLDILGFKQRLKKVQHSNAKEFIAKFAQTAYQIWVAQANTKLSGYIVSDSFVIYSQDSSEEALSQLVNAIEKICRAEFIDNGILVRGAISRGEFDKLVALDLANLEHGLIVGQAYVDAYLMEDSFKAIGIALSEDVYYDMCTLQINGNTLREKREGEDKPLLYVLKYLTLDFLLEENNLDIFINLAIDSDWLPHYYNTLEFALANEASYKKVEQAFFRIMDIVSAGNPSENWRRIDTFIEKAFDQNVSYHYKKRFLRFLRQKIYNS